MSDRFQYLHQSHIEGQTKYIYFLLAAAASGIGLAINMTTDAQLTWSQAPLGTALLLWGASFLSGVKAITQRNIVLGLNAQAVELADKDDKGSVFTNVLAKSINDKVKGEHTFRKWQLYLLVLGAVLFVSWHIIEMYYRTTALAPQDTDAVMFFYTWAIMSVAGSYSHKRTQLYTRR